MEQIQRVFMPDMAEDGSDCADVIQAAIDAAHEHVIEPGDDTVRRYMVRVRRVNGILVREIEELELEPAPDDSLRTALSNIDEESHHYVARFRNVEDGVKI